PGTRPATRRTWGRGKCLPRRGRWRNFAWCCSTVMSSSTSIEAPKPTGCNPWASRGGGCGMTTYGATLDRRRFLYHLGASLGGVALTSLLAREQARAGPLAARPPHHPARARACIVLLMEGGPSHIDTFDPKPRLQGLHLTEF